jgi:uncharacterized protein YyaL (SSP411 family)
MDGRVGLADGLLDLAVLTGEERYREIATEAIESFAGAWDRIGVQVAGYGSVAARLTNGDLVVDVGGEAGSDLHRAALRIADHETVVVPEAEGVEPGTARLRGSDQPPASTPDELLARVSEAAETGAE